MNALSISYRFSRSELSAMLQALRIGALPGAPLGPLDEDAALRVLRQISDEGRAMIVGGTLYVDKLTDYLLRAAAGAKSAAVLTDGSRSLVLWATERLYILGDFPEQGECALTPLQDLDAARAALEDAVRHLSRPLWGISVFAPEKSFNVPANGALTESQIAHSVVDLL